MKKTWKSLILTGVLSLSLSIPTFAGSWKSDAIGYWYQNDDGTYPISCWQWIDGNNDGIAESYYFNDKGYILVNTTTPDGYTVDANGAWIVDGVVQTQTVSTQSQKQEVQTSIQTKVSQPEKTQQKETSTQNTSNTSAAKNTTGISQTPYEGYTIIVNTSTQKYHNPGCASVSKMKDKNKAYANDTSYLESHGYVPCKNCH